LTTFFFWLQCTGNFASKYLKARTKTENRKPKKMEH